MRTKTRWGVVIALLFFTAVSGMGQRLLPPLKKTHRSFVDYFKSIATNENRTPQEKVYLHLDNNAYLMGETLWFKAYVVRAASLSPTTLSQVLYVELLNNEGEMVKRKVLHVVKGQAYGEFKLDELVHSGFYEVRAYTRSMLNWGAAIAFSRVVPIYDPTEKAKIGDYSTLKMYESSASTRLARLRPEPVPYGAASTKSEQGYHLTFYPEGGNRIAGLPSRMAYKLTDKQGVAQSNACSIYNAAGTLLATSTPLHEGMGLLEVPAEATYAEVARGSEKPVRFDLPLAQPEGCTLQVTSKEDALQLRIGRSAALSQRVLGLSLTSRGAACYFDTLAADKTEQTIPLKDLRDGINQLTLFSSEGALLAERLVWKSPTMTKTELTVQQNAAVYQPFHPVILKFSLHDNHQTPVGGVFSLAVHDAKGDVNAEATGIKQDLLLTSDLRGYVANPAYYFESDEADRLKALDLLLMVQGWRRYNWNEMAEVDTFVLKHPIEEGQLIDGCVQDLSSKRKPIPGAKVEMVIFLPHQLVQGSCETDSVGHFSMMPPLYEGEGVGGFSIFVNEKLKGSRVLLNRNFRPAPRAYEPQELNVRSPQGASATERSRPVLFEWTDTFKGKVIALPDATVTGKKKDDYNTGRYTWQGGEQEGKERANQYYNIEDEIEALQDRGDEIPLIWEWLRDRNANFDFDNGDLEASARYKGKPVIFKIDNDELFPKSGVRRYDPTFFADEIKSVIISEYQRGVEGTVIYLYTRPVAKTSFHAKKGERITRFHGFAVPEEYYSPNYRVNDVPVLSDYRRTLFWAPNVMTNAQGNATVSFFSNAREQMAISISAQGLTFKGGLIELTP
ncbi:MAG: hypothetical protein RR280_07280 [Bacteroidaceae bacterium]